MILKVFSSSKIKSSIVISTRGLVHPSVGRSFGRSVSMIKTLFSILSSQFVRGGGRCDEEEQARVSDEESKKL